MTAVKRVTGFRNTGVKNLRTHCEAEIKDIQACLQAECDFDEQISWSSAAKCRPFRNAIGRPH